MTTTTIRKPNGLILPVPQMPSDIYQRLKARSSDYPNGLSPQKMKEILRHFLLYMRKNPWLKGYPKQPLTSSEIHYNVANIILNPNFGAPCPQCGGKDRFSYAFPDQGKTFCRKCGCRDPWGKRASDFLGTLCWVSDQSPKYIAPYVWREFLVNDIMAAQKALYAQKGVNVYYAGI